MGSSVLACSSDSFWHQAKQTAEITAILYEKGYLEMD